MSISAIPRQGVFLMKIPSYHCSQKRGNHHKNTAKFNNRISLEGVKCIAKRTGKAFNPGEITKENDFCNTW